MKQARFYIMLVFISFCAPAQNRPGIDYYRHSLAFLILSVQYFTRQSPRQTVYLQLWKIQGGGSKRTIITLNELLELRADQFGV
jgi:hypothetical protein